MIHGSVTTLTFGPKGPEHRATTITSQDGNILAKDERTGLVASGANVPAALDELRRQLAARWTA